MADFADEFEQAVVSLGWTAYLAGPARSAGRGGALAYLRNADSGGAFGLLHAVTSPWPASWCCPRWPEEDRDAALGYVWQAAAALHVAYDIDRVTAVALVAAPSPETLVELALASGDEHAIKLTQAAFRTFARSGDSVVPLAAADASARL